MIGDGTVIFTSYSIELDLCHILSSCQLPIPPGCPQCNGWPHQVWRGWAVSACLCPGTGPPTSTSSSASSTSILNIPEMMWISDHIYPLRQPGCVRGCTVEPPDFGHWTRHPRRGLPTPGLVTLQGVCWLLTPVIFRQYFKNCKLSQRRTIEWHLETSTALLPRRVKKWGHCTMFSWSIFHNIASCTMQSRKMSIKNQLGNKRY